LFIVAVHGSGKHEPESENEDTARLSRDSPADGHFRDGEAGDCNRTEWHGKEHYSGWGAPFATERCNGRGKEMEVRAR